jgi:hypothetical protein
LWFVALLLAGIGIFLLIATPVPKVFSLIFVLVGLAILLSTGSLTITADGVGRTLKLDYRSLLSARHKEIAFADISSIDVERHLGWNLSRLVNMYLYTYRITAVLKDGSLVPFHSYYSSNSKQTLQRADQLRHFIGIQGVDAVVPNSLSQEPPLPSVAYREQQQAMTGDEAQEHVTDGVHWFVQTYTYANMPVTRWFSPDFQVPGSFLYIVQKMHGQRASSAGALSRFVNQLLMQSLRVYGFQVADTPGLDQAQLLAQVDTLLQADFTVYTADLAVAARLLNRTVVLSLSTWAERYPLRQFGRSSIGQLAVLFGASGVYVAAAGSLLPEQVDEITSLGVALVGAQGEQPAAPANPAS